MLLDQWKQSTEGIRTSNHITKMLRNKNPSFWTVETWFCYILSKMCLGITKKELKRLQKTICMSSFLPPGACFMCPWLPQPHQTERRDVQFGNLSSFSLQWWLGFALHLFVTWFCSCCVPSPPSDIGWILTWNFFLCPRWALMLTCSILLLLWFPMNFSHCQSSFPLPSHYQYLPCSNVLHTSLANRGLS